MRTTDPSGVRCGAGLWNGKKKRKGSRGRIESAMSRNAYLSKKTAEETHRERATKGATLCLEYVMEEKKLGETAREKGNESTPMQRISMAVQEHCDSEGGGGGSSCVVSLCRCQQSSREEVVLRSGGTLHS